ncbi:MULTISPECIES: hypothetical protein [unclassified Staphylococcus]|uniref:hypothetical protein n=1 Tax=unclassified Staphylococcus TaxID=91994 RepID=UPI00166190E4|nr:MULTISPECIES: hypothetical protein [unclassified Staphylococcus]
MRKQKSMKERYELDKQMYKEIEDKNDNRTIEQVAEDFSEKLKKLKKVRNDKK